jgi:hypothetical protein
MSSTSSAAAGGAISGQAIDRDGAVRDTFQIAAP